MRLKNRTIGLLVAFAAALAVTGCSDATQAETTTPPDGDGGARIETFAVNCLGGHVGPGEQPEIMKLRAGELLELTDPSGQLNSASCASRTRGDEPEMWVDPVRFEGRTLYAVGTAADRFDVRAEVDTRYTPARITVTHHTLGADCATTAEWRGALTLIIDTPDGEPAPRIEYRTEAAPCD